MPRKKIPAVAYLRTSSPTNANKGLSSDKDSDQRQRAAVMGFAKSNGYEIVAEFCDVVSGTDPIGARPGFKAMLDRIAANGVRSILIESPDRFARDLAVQLAGHDFLRKQGVALIPTTAPDYFTADSPTAILVRQVLGAVSEFEKTSLVAKLKAARDRKKAAGGWSGGRYGYAKEVPEAVAAARELRAEGLSLRAISAAMAERGLLTSGGKPYAPASVAKMVGGAR
jgi:DNA invertase Pin-like site-specific DNA recombinase